MPIIPILCTISGNSSWVNNFTNEKSIITVFLLLSCSLVYDSATNNYSNASGVEVKVPGFGGTRRVEYLDADDLGFLPFFPYFHDFVDYFVDRGYERGKTIRAAPYDWRLAAGVCLHSYAV